MQKPFFHHYHLTQLLDQQKYKSTYLAYPQGDMKLKVVVKIFDEACMLPNHDYAKSLTAMKGFLALDHAHIVPILNMDIENRQPYIVTHYMAHGSLRQRLDSLSPERMHWTMAVNMVIQIAEALMYAHKRQMVHANIKPSNIFFDFAGEVLLADFRPSHFIDISKLGYKTNLQTTSYMAPEQFMGKSSPSSDQYALACLTYELLTGRTPFSEAQNFSLMWQKHASEQPPPLTAQIPEVPVAIKAAILKAMSKTPEMRYPDIATFVHALERELPASAIRKGKATRPSELESPRPSSPPRRERHTIKLSALTASVPIFEDTQSVKKVGLTRSVPNPVTPDTVSEEVLTSAMSKVFVAKKDPDPGIKETTQQDTVSEEKLTPNLPAALVAKKDSHSGRKDTRPLALAVPSSADGSAQEADVTQKIQQKRRVLRNALFAAWKKQRFRPSKRFVLLTCTLVLVVILSSGHFLLNGLSVETHQTSLSSGSGPQKNHTRQAVAGVFATTTPNVTAGASVGPVTATAGATSSPAATTPSGNGGNSGNGGSSGGSGGNNGNGGNTGTPPTTANTPTPVITNHNRAHSSVISASSSYEANGWSIAYINDDITNSTPNSMGWSSANTTGVNHTEWIKFDFGSVLSVGRVDLFHRNDPGNVGQGFPVNFNIQISSDGVSWTTVVTQSNYPLPTSTIDLNDVFFFPSQNARYLMVEGTTLRQVPSDGNRYRMQFSEILIF